MNCNLAVSKLRVASFCLHEANKLANLASAPLVYQL